jgi:hypothetical protein
MSKIDRECLTKSERQVLHLIMRNTLHKNTPLKREKRSFKMSNQRMALDVGCNERTIQRAIKRLSGMDLIKRNTPPKKFLRGAHYIAISDSFYERTKNFFDSEKMSAHKEKNVGPIKRNNNKTISPSPRKISKKTITNINRQNVQFFISDEILRIDLHGLDEKIGLTHSDLQTIQNKAKWNWREIQESLSNFANALETGLFVAKTTPKIALISILGGTSKRLPSLFNKVTVAKKETASAIAETKSNNEKALQESQKENHWLALSDSKKQEYLTRANNDLPRAITLALSDYFQTDSEYSLSALLANLGNFDFDDIEPRKEKNSKIKFKLE